MLKVLRILPCLASLIFFSNVYAEDWKGICETNFPPYNFIRDDKPIGMDTEIINLVAKQANVSVKLETAPWARVVKSLEDGAVDLAWQFADNPERRQKFILVGPLRVGETVFIVPKKSPLKSWSKLEDFDGKTIGVVREFKYSKDFDAYTKFKAKDESSNNEKLVQKALDTWKQGDSAKDWKVDAIVGDRKTLVYELEKQKAVSEVIVLDKVLTTMPRFVAFNKKDTIKAEKFQKALDEIKNSKEYKDILAKYDVK